MFKDGRNSIRSNACEWLSTDSRTLESEARDTAQLVEYFPNIQEALSLLPSKV